MNYHKQSSFLIFLALLLLFCSCKKKYPNEDLIIRYTVENAKQFENKNEFTVLTIRTPLLSCAASLEKHDYKSILSETKQNFAHPLFIISDWELSLYGLDSVLYEDYTQILECPFVLDKYAYPYTPTAFRIKNKKIETWKEY